MPHLNSKPRAGSRHQPQVTRAAILDAAIREFAHEGVAGARTDAIARAAGVNKALLYYYFKDKETLYGAVLDQVFQGLLVRVSEVLDSGLPPSEKILGYAAAHFDYIASAPLDPKLVQHELMRAGRGSPHVKRLAKSYFAPLMSKLARVIEEGKKSGEFRQVHTQHFITSMIAVIVFYFSATPITRLVLAEDPLAPRQLAERRAAVLDFISAALFKHKGARA